MGCRLNDTLAPDFPFTNLFYGDVAESVGDGPYTARDVWDGTTILDAVYAYDTVLDMVERTDEDEDEDGDEDEDMKIAGMVVGLVIAGLLMIAFAVYVRIQ